MATNDIVTQFQKLCNDLLRSVQCAQPGTGSFEMETRVFDGLLELGRLSMEAYFEAQAPNYHHSTAQDAEGRVLRYSGEHAGLFYSVFGTIEYSRSYYCGDGHGVFAMDAALNLPPKGQSDYLRMMIEELSINMSYEDATTFVAQYFPVATSTRGVQAAIQADSQDAQDYYAQALPAPECEAASILVVQADGKGVPMVKRGVVDADSEATPGRPKAEPGRKGKTKEANVVSVSTHIPFVRTPEEVRDNLFKARIPADEEPGHVREKPEFKRVWATMTGKDSALDQAAVFVAQADSQFITDRVSLTDGQIALQARVDEKFPNHTRVLDIIHAIQYLWKASDAKFGKGTKDGWCWVYDAVLLMLAGKTLQIANELFEWARIIDDRGNWQPIERAANYFDANLPAMKYDEYLQKGWPIATGIIEGACRHVVKDRCERSGMRWTEAGVEAFLHLRCVHQNGDWDSYHAFRMKRRHQVVYGVANDSNGGLLDNDITRFTIKNSYGIAA